MERGKRFIGKEEKKNREKVQEETEGSERA